MCYIMCALLKHIHHPNVSINIYKDEQHKYICIMYFGNGETFEKIHDDLSHWTQLYL